MPATHRLPIKDIHLPPAISWWPLAPAWYITSGLLLALIILATKILVKRRRKLKEIRIAQRQLNQLKSEPSNAATIAKLSYLLKQVCIHYFPTTDGAHLTGSKWLQFLDQSIDFHGFEQKGKSLVTLAYQKPGQPAETLPLIALTEDWLHALAHTIKNRRGRQPCSS